ncbi:hypothetical protein F5146DRAFT_1221561 [Armillaria mellea]|nr:hypothetical protein F5146DRAFT_1221561 [Armillaria mellea]
MSGRRPHDVYRNLLLRERHGYPLWIPESDYNLPGPYRDKGVSVGDLGILTDDGGFDFLFNACAEADDPVNCGRVPPQFKPLRISCGSTHTIRKIPYHCRNSSITSAHVSRTEFTIEGSAQITPFVTGRGGFEFSLQSAEAAILMLPDGGYRYDTMHRALFEQYAVENGHSWYVYVNSFEYLARQAPNGSLYLVTGCDKARTWMIAAASRPSKSCAISVRFGIGPIMEGRIALQTSWSTPHSASASRIYPDYPDPMPQQDNQCVFMRGFTISVRENSFKQKIFGRIRVKAIGGSSRNAAPSFSSRSPYSSHQGDTAGPSSSGVVSSTGPVDNLDMPDYSTNDEPKSLLNDGVELIDLPGRSTELLNPSAKINEHILALNPHVTVAVTHDEDWMNVIKDIPPDQWPDNFQLASMVLDLFKTPVQFQGSPLLGNSFQSLYASEQLSSPSVFTIRPYNYSQSTLSTFQNTLLTEFEPPSPSPTTNISSLPKKEQNIGGGLDSLAGKRYTRPANTKCNLRRLLERSVASQHRKKEHAAKRIREQAFQCTFDGCTKTYTASHNFKGAVLIPRLSSCII